MKNALVEELRSAAQYAAAHAPNEEFLLWSLGKTEEEIRLGLGTYAFVQLLVTKTAPWAHLHAVADAAEPKIKKVANAAFAAGHRALKMAVLRQALKKGNERKVLSIVSPAIEATEKALYAEHGMQNSFEQLLFDTLVHAGEAAAKRFRPLRAAAPKIKGFTFNADNPAAAKWAREHAADTIKGITEATRNEIRDVIDTAFGQDDYDVNTLADDIASIIGDDARAETIARTEAMEAANRGQQELWSQAVDAGLLTGQEEQEWIVANDDRLCPICEPMDGVRVGLDESFDVDGEEMDGPPAHPNCRCVLGLVAAKG